MPKTLVRSLKKYLKHPVFSSHAFHVLTIGTIAGLTAVGGTYLTLSSFASTPRPTGTLDIITYESLIDDANKIGGVTVTIDQGGSGVQCSPSSGTTDGAPGGNHGHVHLTCGSANDGGPLTYKLSGVSRDGFKLVSNSPHQIGDTFHVSKGQTTTLSLVLYRVPTSEGSGGGGGGGTSTHGDPGTPPPSTPNGTVDVVTYEGSVKAGNEIGGVSVHITAGGSGVACVTSPYVTTDPDSGGNHGHAHLTCPAAANGDPRAYTLASADRDGYRVSASSPHTPGNYGNGTFHVSGNTKTTLSIVLERVGGSGSGGSTSTEGGSTTTPPPGTPDGDLTVTTWKDSVKSGNELGGVTVHIISSGGGVSCSRSEFTTGVTSNLGKAHVTCPAGSKGGFRTYELASATKDGYELSKNSPTGKDDPFQINAKDKKVIHVVLHKVETKTPSTKADDKTGDKTKTNTDGAKKPTDTDTKKVVTPYCNTKDATAGVKATPRRGTGNLVVCAYDITDTASKVKVKPNCAGTEVVTCEYVPNAQNPFSGGQVPLEGVEVHLDSVGPSIECPDRSERTSNKTSDGSFGRATFTNCPITGDGEYMVSYVHKDKYHEAANSPHKAGCKDVAYHFRLKANETHRIPIYMVKGSGSNDCATHTLTESELIRDKNGSIIGVKASAACAVDNCGGEGTKRSKEASELRKRIVAAAQHEANIHYREGPNNSVKYFHSEGKSWGSIFVSWTWHVAGVHNFPGSYDRQAITHTRYGDYFKDPGGFAEWASLRGNGAMHQAKENGKYIVPEPGDAVWYGSGGNHLGIVEKVFTDLHGKLLGIVTIDGNVSYGSGKQGVYRSPQFFPNHSPRDGSPVLDYISPVEDY